MRLACLQFAPQVGDTDNNLNRADAVLAKADQDDLDSLDLIVLPELAFSGWNFQSSKDIAPYLEPSGSGISSLWARTIALKHNTNVLVGYPERVDVSGNHQAGPEFYNSAILVNGDGETVANYRKTFLYRLDEAWAHEGKGFFGDHIPGLGNTAIGICTDINPYRLEAPWHAFEFAFHILEVRASLVIVTMAWLTGEDCEQFTQFPDEPDMEALTYWAQRLEPVIRDESRDEIIIVFCNRTGIEDDAVYSGTSAVIGIHHGEVNVYGLLGRGVKDLLVVDTEDPPFASLILRKEKFYLSPLEHETKHKGQASGRDGLHLTPLPADVHDNTPTKYLAEEPISTSESGEVRMESSKPPVSPTLNMAVAEISDIPTPTAPSPVPLEARPKFDTSKPCLVGNRTDDNDSEAERILENVRICDYTAALPVRSPESRKASPVSIRNAEPNRTCRAEQPEGSQGLTPRESGNDPGATPVRPSSPKSRNVSRVGRHRRRLSGPEQPGLAAALDGCDNAQQRAQSAVAQQRDYNRIPTYERPRPPQSHSTSLLSRYPGVDDAILERALDFYLRSIAINLRNEITASGDHSHRPGTMNNDPDPVCDDAARPPSQEHHYLSSDPGRSGPVDGRLLQAAEQPNIWESHETQHAMLWKEISKLVGEHVRRTESKDDLRGRRRSRSASTAEARQARGDTPYKLSPARSREGRVRSRSGASNQARRESRSMSTPRRSTPSHTAQRDGVPIRSVRDPSLGPPSDPNDEIVAEIIFRRPCCAAGDSKCDSTGKLGAQIPAPESTASKKSTQQICDDTSTQRTMQRLPSDDESEKTPTASRQTAARQDLGLLALQTSAEDLDDLQAPQLSTASVHTLSSYEASPVTPPPNTFDPRTPKPMILGLDCAPVLPPVTDSLSMTRGRHLEQFLCGSIAAQIERPRSSLL